MRVDTITLDNSTTPEQEEFAQDYFSRLMDLHSSMLLEYNLKNPDEVAKHSNVINATVMSFAGACAVTTFVYANCLFQLEPEEIHASREKITDTLTTYTDILTELFVLNVGANITSVIFESGQKNES
jgi:hypothetical protein